jgi:hypothetical protein
MVCAAEHGPGDGAGDRSERRGDPECPGFCSLQLTLNKRFGNSFPILANYAFAKSIDYGSGADTLWPDYSLIKME